MSRLGPEMAEVDVLWGLRMAEGFLVPSNSAWHIICAQQYLRNKENENK